MIEDDKRAIQVPIHPGRRYEDAKAASARAAERIAQATAECVEALRSYREQPKRPQIREAG